MSINRKDTLDTLAQSGKGYSTNQVEKRLVLVSGKGSDLTDEKRLKGRAKKKLITQTMVLGLIKIAERKGDLKFKKALWNTYHCQNRVYSSGGRLHGKYCKNRFCTICCGNRKAEKMRTYLPKIRAWKEPYFVTLTVKAVPAARLNKVVEKVIEGFQRIKEKYRNSHRSGKTIKLIGVKSLECNFNPVKKTYNPHLHIIVASKEIADTLVKEWLSLWVNGWTIECAQQVRPIKDMERDLRETVKYGTKIFTEPDVNKKSKQKVPRRIYVAALYNILEAMQGHRLFDRFGFNLPAGNKYNTGKVTPLINSDEWVYEPKINDWINPETREILTQYLPTSELLNLLANNIDTELQ